MNESISDTGRRMLARENVVQPMAAHECAQTAAMLARAFRDNPGMVAVLKGDGAVGANLDNALNRMNDESAATTRVLDPDLGSRVDKTA